jgi:hypothetical protein
MSASDLDCNDNVVQFPGRKIDAELWQAAVGHITPELDAFRDATDQDTADKALDLMRQGPVVFNIKRHELVPAGAKGADKAERQRQINALARAFEKECKRAGLVRRVAGAEAASIGARAAGRLPAEHEIIDEYAFDEVRGTFIRIELRSVEMLHRSRVKGDNAGITLRTRHLRSPQEHRGHNQRLGSRQ